MYTRQQIPKKPRTNSSSTPVQSSLFRQRPFKDEADQAAVPSQQQDTPDLQTQIERAARFGHNFGRVQVHADTPSSAIQTKLAVGAPGDKYEQEADQVAAQVMSTAAPVNQQPIQRQGTPEQEEEVAQTKPLAASITPLIQRETLPEQEEQEVAQTKPLAGLTIQREMTPEQEEQDEKAQVQTKPLAGLTIQREMAPEQEEQDEQQAVQTKPLAGLTIQREMAPEQEEQDEKAQVQTKPLAGLTIQREMAPEQEEQDEQQAVQAKSLTGLTIQRETAPEQEEQDEQQAVQTKPLAGLTIQRDMAPQQDEQDEPQAVQKKRSLQAQEGSFKANSDIESQLSSSKGGGTSLPDEVRTFMEPRFGANFSQVRVHTDSQAVQMNQALGAQAFTHGHDIYFGAGKSPAISDLTAHELTHVVQQTGGASNVAAKIQRKGPAKKISTPLGKDAKLQKDGSATFQVAKANVIVKPDTTTKDKEMTGRAQTNCNLNWKTPSYQFKDDLVTKVDTLPPVNLSIQTVYGPGVTAESSSDYGKGTTKEDKEAGKTSLGHHEGSHGLDAIQYLKDHPLPVFTGKEGMTVDEYQQAVDKYNQEMQEYQANLEKDSKEKTDCVGKKADFCD